METSKPECTGSESGWGESRIWAAGWKSFRSSNLNAGYLQVRTPDHLPLSGCRSIRQIWCTWWAPALWQEAGWYHGFPPVPDVDGRFVL